MFRYGHFAHGPGVFGWLVFALFIALVVVAVVALVRTWRNLGHAPFAYGPPGALHHPIDPALNELRIRYARGEIDWNEYVHRASNLGFPLTPPGPYGGPPPGAPPSSPGEQPAPGAGDAQS